MKKVLIITAITLAILLIVGFLLYKPYQKWRFKSKVNKIAIEYVTNILLINDFDSIKISKIDTLSDLGFAKLSIEMLEEMNSNYELAKTDAILNGESDEAIQQIESQQQEVELKIADFFTISNDEKTDSKNIKFYFVNAFLYYQGKEIPFIFLMTPDCKYYEYDLFKE